MSVTSCCLNDLAGIGYVVYTNVFLADRGYISISGKESGGGWPSPRLLLSAVNATAGWQ